MPISIELCCNDWRNGVDQGYAENIKLFECDLTGGRVRTDWLRDRRPNAIAADGDSTLRIGRLLLPCLSYRTWHGNWCWDSARVRLIHAVAIWNYLAKKPDWHCEGGPCELYDLFNRHGEIAPKGAPEFLHRILHPELSPGGPNARL